MEDNILMMQIFIDTKFAGNELWRIASFFLVILLSLVAGKLCRISVARLAKKAPAKGRGELLGVLFGSIASPLVLIVFVIGFRLGLLVLRMSDRLLALMSTLSSILNAIAIGFLIYGLVDIVDHYLGKLANRTESKVDDLLAPLVGKAIRITVLVLVILNVAVEVSGKDITTILASLGVGGLAIALAGQDTIRNFFGSMVIFADKPFEIGDRIVIDGHDGPVETVGFRSTKVRTLDGHLVTVPNSEMVNRTVQNIGKRPYIKRVANITVTYDTPPEKVDRALEIIKEILRDHEGMDPDFPPRVYFSDFNDWSLNILIIYWYHPPDYWKYMAFSEKINREILQRFNDEGIEFAFPTQTVHVNKVQS